MGLVAPVRAMLNYKGDPNVVDAVRCTYLAHVRMALPPSTSLPPRRPIMTPLHHSCDLFPLQMGDSALHCLAEAALACHAGPAIYYGSRHIEAYDTICRMLLRRGAAVDVRNQVRKHYIACD